MSLIEGLQLPFGIQPVNPVPSNTWSGPYSGTTEALASIPLDVRFPTMEVRILSASGNTMYWFKDGINDLDLVPFGVDFTPAISGETEARIAGDNYLLGLITGETANRVSGDTLLNSLITGETANRITGDTYLFELITGLTNNKFDKSGGTITGNIIISGGTITGDGSGLTNIPASGVTGLNLDRITSDGGSAVITNTGLTVNTTVYAESFVKSGGTSNQFLKADGSVDSNSYSLTGHTHDDRYYTESEINQFLSGKSDTGHTHNDLYNLITGETASRISGDTILNNLITGETANRISGDTYLFELITGLTNNKFDKSGGTINGNVFINGNISGDTFYGDGSGLTNIPASGVTGLNLDRITYGDNSAIMSSSGLTINTGITATNLSGTNTGDERYTNLTPTDSSIGGIPVGSTFSGKTVQQMFDSLLYPTLNPTLTNPSSTFTVSLNTYYEIGQTIASLAFNSSFSRGSITPAYGTSGYRSGLPTQYNYTGSGLSNVVSSGLTNSVSITNYTVIAGTNSWTGSVTYSAGEQPKNNKGDNYSTPLPSGTTGTITRSFTGIYPFLYGMSDLVLDTNNAYTNLAGKLIEVQGNKTVTLNGNLKYIYFIYPATYSDLVSIIDQNGFNVTGSFQKTTMNVTSSGLGSNWTTSYKIYRTINMTTVLSGQYQFKFS